MDRHLTNVLEFIKEFGCGVRKATLDELQLVYTGDPYFSNELPKYVEKSLPANPHHYVYDVKVHMLKAGMYPCIPNWHRDLVPRVDGIENESLINPNHTMYLWVSGDPLTEFKDGREVKPCTWVPFTQNDWHRGTPCQEKDTWRMFIRAIPIEMIKENEAIQGKPFKKGLVRHSQVYVDANTIVW